MPQQNIGVGIEGKTYVETISPIHFPQAVVVKRLVKSGLGSSNRTSSELKAVESDSECHFLMNSNNVVAALDLCSEAGVSGVIVTKSHAVMELLPHR